MQRLQNQQQRVEPEVAMAQMTQLVQKNIAQLFFTERLRIRRQEQPFAHKP